MQTTTKNVFFAFELPESAMRIIESLQHDLQRHFRGALIRWTGEVSWHVVTHRADCVSSGSLDNLKNAMSQIQLNPVSFTFWSLDIFPSLQNPKKIVLRLADTTDSALQVHNAHIPILHAENVHMHTREWQPHITLGRLSGVGSGITADLATMHVPQETVGATKLTLFEHLSNSSVKYQPIRAISLPRT